MSAQVVALCALDVDSPRDDGAVVVGREELVGVVGRHLRDRRGVIAEGAQQTRRRRGSGHLAIRTTQNPKSLRISPYPFKQGDWNLESPVHVPQEDPPILAANQKEGKRTLGNYFAAEDLGLMTDAEKIFPYSCAVPKSNYASEADQPPEVASAVDVKDVEGVVVAAGQKKRRAENHAPDHGRVGGGGGRRSTSLTGQTFTEIQGNLPAQQNVEA